MALRFDWDPRKAASNKIKHGVTFDQAITVWDDPGFLDIHDLAHSRMEDRFIRVGWSDKDILVVVYTKREFHLIRIISARKASHKERRLYHETNQKD